MMRPDLDRFIAGWRGPVLAALIALRAGLPVLALMPPLDRDESRYAQATSQMLESGDFVDIRFQTEARHKKPVGIYWMQSATVALGEALGGEGLPAVIVALGLNDASLGLGEAGG